MSQTVFLDTNVILDYLESRNHEVRDIVAQLLLFHKNDRIVLTTSVFNVAELIDKEFEIHHIADLLSQKFSYSEILRQRGDKKGYRETAARCKDLVKEKVRNFIFSWEIKVLSLPFPITEDGEASETGVESYEELYNLIYENQFSSQDAFIIATALSNRVTYFLSNDDDIVRQIGERNLIDAYNLRNESQREDFRNTVLDTLAQVLI